MSNPVKIYGINNCDTVKKAIKFLSGFALPYEFIDYRENPISESLFETIQNML